MSAQENRNSRTGITRWKFDGGAEFAWTETRPQSKDTGSDSVLACMNSRIKLGEWLRTVSQRS